MVTADRWRGLADLCTTRVRDALGLTATYTPAATGIPQPLVKAPYDGAYAELVLQNGVPDSVTRQVWDVRLLDLPAYPALGDKVELTPVGQTTSIVLVVQDIQPGGQGTVKLFMALETAP